MPKNILKSSINDKFFLLFPIIAILTFVLFNLSHHAFIWIFLILKPFVHGISNFKINFFILYSLILCLLLLLKKGAKSPSLIPLFKRINFVSIILAMITGLLTFLSITQKLKLPLDKYAYHFKGHYVTINYFAHTHTTKLPLYYLTKILHLDRLNETCDTALPLAEYSNQFLVLSLSLFTLIALFCFISLAYDVITKWDKHKQWLVFIIYTFASGHIIKCLIDGGMFSYDLLPSIIAMHILFYSHSPESLLSIIKRNALRYLFILLSFIIIGSAFSRNEAVLQTPIGSIFFICIFTLLFLMLTVNIPPTAGNPAVDERLQRQMKPALRVTISIFCCLYLIFYLNMHSIRDINALMKKVKNNDKILYYSYQPPNNKEFLPRVIDYSLDMLNKRIADVYLELGENPFRNRNVSIISPDDSKAYGFIFVLKVLKSKDEVNLTPNKFMKIQVLQDLTKASDKAFLLKVAFNKALFPSLWEIKPSIIGENNRFAAFFFLNHYFLSCGIEEYIIIPYYYQILS